MNYWTNRVVIITGASSGIGRALARNIGARGARVGLIARRASVLDEVTTEIERDGGTALALAADVEDVSALREVAQQFAAKLGPIDMLIANAGVAPTSHALNLDPAELERVIQVNLLGAANSVAAVLPEMIARGNGHLVAISSMAAYRGLPKSGYYCASKAALSALFESLRIDLKETGITVTIIYPGFIKTPLTAGRSATMPYLMELDEAVEKIVSAIERGKKSYTFPWQLATIVRAGLLMPAAMYDWIASRNSYRE